MLPTAAPASISGREVNASGEGIRRVSLQIVSGSGSFTATTSTDSFGYYSFENVPTGVTYIHNYSKAKRINICP
jgi:hypothetical protein